MPKLKGINPLDMEPELNDHTENKKSTPVENKKPEVKYHRNQSTEEDGKGNMGWIAVLIFIAIVVLGILLFGNFWN